MLLPTKKFKACLQAKGCGIFSASRIVVSGGGVQVSGLRAQEVSERHVRRDQVRRRARPGAQAGRQLFLLLAQPQTRHAAQGECGKESRAGLPRCPVWSFREPAGSA